MMIVPLIASLIVGATPTPCVVVERVDAPGMSVGAQIDYIDARAVNCDGWTYPLVRKYLDGVFVVLAADADDPDAGGRFVRVAGPLHPLARTINGLVAFDLPWARGQIMVCDGAITDSLTAGIRLAGGCGLMPTCTPEPTDSPTP